MACVGLHPRARVGAMVASSGGTLLGAMRWWTRLGIAAVVAAVLLRVAPCPARADALQGLRSVVRVRPGLPCVAADSLIAQVRAWLGDAKLDEPLVVEVDEGHAEGAEFVSYRVLRAGELVATRTLSPAPPSCVAREAALALAIALALRASLARDLDALLRPPEARLRVDLTGRVNRSYAVLPGAAWGGELELALTPRRRLGGALALGVRRAAGLALGRGEVAVSAYTLGLRGCARTPALGRLSAGLCVGGDAGVVRMAGEGYDKSFARRAGYASALGALSFVATLGASFALELRGAASVLLTPIRAVARDEAGTLQERAFRTLGGELALGLRYLVLAR